MNTHIYNILMYACAYKYYFHLYISTNILGTDYMRIAVAETACHAVVN